MVRLLASKHMAVSHACVETLEHRLCAARTHSAKSCMCGMSRLLLPCGDGCPGVPAAPCRKQAVFFSVLNCLLCRVAAKSKHKSHQSRAEEPSSAAESGYALYPPMSTACCYFLRRGLASAVLLCRSETFCDATTNDNAP
jgi:hypothetical protein